MRRRVEIQRLPGGYALKNGRKLVNFSDNDYLGLSFDARLREAAEAALREYGTGAGASRLVSGNHPLYAKLEQALAEYKGTEDALVFGSGFLANLGAVTALVPKDAIILADKLIHASLVDAVKLSGNRFQRFRHNDTAHLRELLQKHHSQPCTIITESIFSMDGDAAPLAEIAALAQEFGALLMVDDAHGLGVVPVTMANTVWIGTFSKAAGGYGGYVCGTSEQIERMVNHARSLIYTTGLPPATIASNLAALHIIASDAALTVKPLANARLFDPTAQSAIVPLILGSDEAALAVQQQLEEAGFLVVAIRPPTVPTGTSRLRFAFSAVHREKDIARLRRFFVLESHS